MVQADVIVGEFSCRQKFFATFFEQNLTLAVINGQYYPTFESGFFADFEDLEKVLKFLQKHRKRRKINKPKVLPVKTTRARARVGEISCQQKLFLATFFE